MLPQDQGSKPIDGLCVYDVLIVTQMIDKLLKSGSVNGREIGFIAALRSKMLNAAKRAGTDIETLGEIE